MQKTTVSRLPPAKSSAPPPKLPRVVEDRVVGTGKRLPPCPNYLGKFGQQAYSSAVQTLRDLKLEDAADARVVEAFAGAYEDYREARAYLADKSGATYQTFTQAGELKLIKYPEVDIMAEAWKRMTMALSQMCMTPVSRIKGKPKNNEEPPADPFAKFLPVN